MEFVPPQYGCQGVPQGPQGLTGPSAGYKAKVEVQDPGAGLPVRTEFTPNSG